MIKDPMQVGLYPLVKMIVVSGKVVDETVLKRLWRRLSDSDKEVWKKEDIRQLAVQRLRHRMKKEPLTSSNFTSWCDEMRSLKDPHLGDNKIVDVTLLMTMLQRLSKQPLDGPTSKKRNHHDEEVVEEEKAYLSSVKEVKSLLAIDTTTTRVSSPRKKQKDGTPVAATTTTTASIDEQRSKVRVVLQTKALADEEVEAATKAALALEEALWDEYARNVVDGLHGEDVQQRQLELKEYYSRVRTLTFNLRQNGRLRARLLGGEDEYSKVLAVMSVEEMATEEQQASRRDAVERGLKAVVRQEKETLVEDRQKIMDLHQRNDSPDQQQEHDNNNNIDKPYDLRVDGNDFDCTVEKFVRDIPHARPGSLKIPMDKFRLANQLDFATSGALVLTLNKTADRETSALFQFRLTKKVYIAVCEGWVGDDELMKPRIITTGISSEGGGKMSSTIAVPVSTGHLLCDDIKCTVYILRLLTGRRHQLRLHLSYIGHPILGDYTYSTHLPKGGRGPTLPRMLLHAWRLTLPFGDLLHCGGKLRKRGQLRHVKDGTTIHVESEPTLLKYVTPSPEMAVLDHAARLAMEISLSPEEMSTPRHSKKARGGPAHDHN
ncbi:Ribosomal large subunit pseudouridine synthase D, putative [Perkinsus marinus ATCC 50983]|uniref:Ribosomal large subunit pseudouridine synthase D, putative n=1 Tax=Perkinsus marinus (strain ATCC 50983 / TXsc) TaxID=423536 RepID=C5K8M1_PERM5|nr:Ribosomal large subunit pseudouridine synthase D, putative [Perkinsus marinus ATCC 50983]EER19228.1 Ribosomal large subunit pseudouridine synthase D, putative [Perkinsus marinus ATCC 50983]|eukprot:XP_002787432.1 Ribosomal large subunit pseudouridine synthase D, putative [Perkinsus marinus ATCC 50983]